MVQDDGEGGSGASWLKLLVIRSSSQPCQQEIVGDAATPGNIRDTGQGRPQPRWTMPAARIRSTPESEIHEQTHPAPVSTISPA